MMDKKYIDKVMNTFMERGYCAYHYPRLHRISIAGGRMLNERTAVDKMLDIMGSPYALTREYL
jgi:hypothetical protein